MRRAKESKEKFLTKLLTSGHSLLHSMQIFLATVWLPNDQIWANIEGTVRLSRCQSLACDTMFDSRGHSKPCNEVKCFLKEPQTISIY